MNKRLKLITLPILIPFFSGCIPAPTPQISLGGIGTGVTRNNRVENQPIIDKEYGEKPINYINAIRSYCSNKIPRANLSQYKYGTPKRAYKRKGFAYGGAIAWKGWLVETSIATPTRTGKLLTPKPYMFLFKGQQVVEHILGYSHKLITKVDK